MFVYYATINIMGILLHHIYWQRSAFHCCNLYLISSVGFSVLCRCLVLFSVHNIKCTPLCIWRYYGQKRGGKSGLIPFPRVGRSGARTWDLDETSASHRDKGNCLQHSLLSFYIRYKVVRFKCKFDFNRQLWSRFCRIRPTFIRKTITVSWEIVGGQTVEVVAAAAGRLQAAHHEVVLGPEDTEVPGAAARAQQGQEAVPHSLPQNWQAVAGSRGQEWPHTQ